MRRRVFMHVVDHRVRSRTLDALLNVCSCDLRRLDAAHESLLIRIDDLLAAGSVEQARRLIADRIGRPWGRA